MRYHSHHTEKGSYEGWIQTNNQATSLFKFQIATRTTLCMAALHVGEEYMSATWAVPYFYINLATRKPKFITSYDREIGVHIHNWTIHWNVWHSTIEWHSGTPKWRCGSFNLLNFVCGRSVYTEHELETREVHVPMPEGTYLATAKLCRATWKRPRSPFTKTTLTVTFDIPKGIPYEGKGTSEWNCGTDATYGMSAYAKSIPEGVGLLVGSVLKDRVRYGGWEDWNWKRNTVETPGYDKPMDINNDK